MTRHVVGLFDDRLHAEAAVNTLIERGVPSTAISAVASDAGGTMRRQSVESSGNMADEGAITGATSGLAIGGLIGLLLGMGALSFTGVGIVAAGPLVGLLTGAGVGAVSGGIIGALIGLGIPEYQAHVYAEGIRRGGMLVSAEVDEALVPVAEAALAQAGAVNIDERAAMYRQQGFTRYDPAAPAYTVEQAIAEQNQIGQLQPAMGSVVNIQSPAAAQRAAETTLLHASDTDFRNDFEQRHAASGLTYESFRPAYEYGHKLALSDAYRNSEWADIENQARQDWETLNPGTWRTYQEAIYEGYIRGRGATASPSSARLL